ncbi:hypothetical protein GCM10011351_26710 [Paraliobacillus quinghaiensis]|uniref:TnsA endonuclease N-terminal domain-containing protein n=1 Tax=Paraliobacillus quinghaiensis TaxID=470815 RepID=A0A917TV29_9BACI|nr:TnsA endonuclease N-terminal domain-containing protein [Paraliobacillus quinghaiensis]GGM39215.1 hypothetical protein GCM10011351_26710 [Paraliobacillus quinghaiensis]
MDWSKKTWGTEDSEFAPKREISNKGSKYFHHLSGYFYSPKMKRQVGYESLWGECLFYYYLELDRLTIRYYEQPVEVPIVVSGSKQVVDSWLHVPDVLVFRQKSKPHLFQIKGSDEEIEAPKMNTINKFCKAYALSRGWEYSLVYPKLIPEVVKSNVLFLWNYIKERRNFSLWIPEITQKLHYLDKVSVIYLARSFSGRTDFRIILPIIYHLIATGHFYTDFLVPINEKSVISLGDFSGQLLEFFELEGNS